MTRRKSGAPATIRVSLELPPVHHALLVELRLKSQARSYSEVIERALRTLNKLQEVEKFGGQLIFKKPDGSELQIILI